jgi:hypothetical protein
MKNPPQELQQEGVIINGDLTADKSISFTNHQVLDLSGLSEGQISELKQEYATGVIDLQKKATELKIEVGALDAALSAFNDQTSRATQSGASATITHTQTTSIGRTEVVMGNTEKAAKGKISRSAGGEEDRTLWIIGVIAIAAVLVAVAL